MLTTNAAVGYTTSKLRALSPEALRNYSSAIVHLNDPCARSRQRICRGWDKSLVDDGIQTTCDSFVATIATGSDEVLMVALLSLLFAVFNQKWFGMADKYSQVAYLAMTLAPSIQPPSFF